MMVVVVTVVTVMSCLYGLSSRSMYGESIVEIEVGKGKLILKEGRGFDVF